MGTKLLAMVALLGMAIGCGDNTEPPIPSNTWALRHSEFCAESIGFNGTRYGRETSCHYPGGDVEMESESGTYHSGAGVVDLLPDLSSCPDHYIGPGTYFYSVGGFGLLMSGPWTTEAMPLVQRHPAGPPVKVVYGCWDDVFTTHPREAVGDSR